MHGAFLSSFFGELNRRGLTWLVERNYAGLPESVSHDVDFLIGEGDEDEFVKAALECAGDGGRNLILRSRAWGGGRLYFGVRASDPRDGILRLDYTTILHCRGTRLLDAGDILGRRRPRGGFHVPAPGGESAISLMIPLAYGGRVKEAYKEGIRRGVAEDGEGFIAAFGSLLPPGRIRRIADLAQAGDFARLEADRGGMLRRLSLGHPWAKGLDILRWGMGYAGRLRAPTGIIVCLLGPDGSGKSSVIEGLARELGVLYPEGRFRRLHWRPGVLPPLRALAGGDVRALSAAAANPHGHAPRGRLSSLLRWVYYAADYPLGHLLRLMPLKAGSAAVIMDRYYYDVLVDPRRYGFNLPARILGWAMPLVPKPDLSIYLDADPVELRRRKQDLPLEELERQVKSWRGMLPVLPHAAVVAADRPLEAVITETASLVMAARSRLTLDAMGSFPEEAGYLWPAGGRGYAVYGRRGSRRWIMPLGRRPALSAWGLFKPYKPAGKAYILVRRVVAAAGLGPLLSFSRVEVRDTRRSRELKDVLEGVFGRKDLTAAASLGTPGPFRKTTLMVMTAQGEVLGYAKVGREGPPADRVRREAAVLRQIGPALAGGPLKLPGCLHEGNVGAAAYLVQTAPFHGRQGGASFDEGYAAILSWIIKRTGHDIPFDDAAFTRKLREGIERYPAPFKEDLAGGPARLERAMGQGEVLFSLAHGDFAPWNTLWRGEEACLFDWESSEPEAPAGLDLAHFIFQTGYLLKGMRGERLLAFLRDEGRRAADLMAARGVRLPPWKTLVLAWLLNRAVEEDMPDPLNTAAVERRRLLGLILSRGEDRT